jgi:insulysin
MGVDIRKAVMEFHSKYYSSNIMSLAILGRESLDELQSLAETIFLQVPNRNATMPTWPETPYTKEYMQTKIEIVPIKDIRSISINFPIPYEAIDYKTSVS